MCRENLITISYELSEGHHKTTFGVTGTTHEEELESGITHTVTGKVSISFEQAIDEFTLKFYDTDNQNVLQTATVEYNQNATFTENQPTKDQDETYTYTFAGWNTQPNQEEGIKEFNNVKADADYYPAFSKEYREYKVTFPEHVSVTYVSGTSTKYDNNKDIATGNTVHHGDKITISYELTDGYEVSKFTINEQDYSSQQSVTFTVQGEVSIEFEAKINGPFSYQLISEDQGYMITGLLDKTITDLVIPDEYEEKPVIEIAANAFKDESQITSLTIGKNVKTIHGGAFDNLSNLKEITINSDFETPDRYTLQADFDIEGGYPTGEGSTPIFNNSFVDEITIHLNVALTKANDEYLIGFLEYGRWDPTSYGLFGGNNNIHLILGKDVEGDWHQKLFDDNNILSVKVDPSNDVYTSQDKSGKECNVLINKNSKTIVCGSQQATIPDDGSVTIIGDHAFHGCSGLTGITIPLNITSIGTYAFAYCSGLTGITIPSSVTSIGDFAFYGCHSITSLTIPSSVTSIGIQAFRDPSPNSVYYAGTLKQWCETEISGRSEILFKEANLYIHGQKIEGELIITEDITKISDYAFAGHSSITSLNISNGVTTIGNYAFSYCSGLNSLTIQNGVTSIGNYAFYGLTNVTKLEYNANITTVFTSQSYLFSDLGQNVEDSCEVIIGEDVTNIPAYLFYRGLYISILTIGSSVTSIGDYAFKQCLNLEQIIINSSAVSKGLTSDDAMGGLLENISAGELVGIKKGLSCSSYIRNHFHSYGSNGGYEYYRAR